MKLRSFFLILATGFLVLLLIGAGGFYWLTSHSPLTLLRGGTATNPAAAIFVPKQAPVMVSLLANIDRLEAFRQLVARPAERRRSRRELNQIKQSLLANTGLDYQRDVQPWLGDEISLAVTTLDIDRNPQNGQQPGYLLAVTTRDANRSREFLDLFWQQRSLAGTELAFEQYNGVKLIYGHQSATQTQLKTQNSLASALVGDRFLLFANDPKVLRDAINNVQAPDLNLQENPSYQLALQNLSEPGIATAFVNLPELSAEFTSPKFKDSASKNYYQSLAIALSLKRQGLVAQTALIGASDREIADTIANLSQPVAALQHIPSTSGFVLAGSNLQQLWERISAGVENDDKLSQLIKQFLVSRPSSWGINLPQDIFNWVQGEYALALLPRPDKPHPDWIFVAEKSAESPAAIEHLDAIAKQNGFSVGSLPLGNRAITGWTKLITAPANKGTKEKSPLVLKAQVEGVRATVGKYEILATSIEAIDQALKAPNDSLLASTKFKGAITPLDQPNHGYLYLDWNATQPILEKQLPIFQVVELAGKPLFDNLGAIALSSYGTKDGVQRSQISIKLGKG